jgi:hypothetical protein
MRQPVLKKEYSSCLGNSYRHLFISQIMMKSRGKKKQLHLFLDSHLMLMPVSVSTPINSQWCEETCHNMTHRFSPMPMASVATRTLQELSGSLNFWAWASFVPGGKPP